MRELIALRHARFRDLMKEVDHVVAVCQWAKELLLRNGVPVQKVTVSRHGLPEQTVAHQPADSLSGRERPLRVAFLGRLDPIKGTDLLIQAVLGIPDAPLQLDVFGIRQEASDGAYVCRVEALAARDPRIRLLAPLPSTKVVGLLRNYHLLAVPSRCLETGPLVVLEAFAAGIPVVGSDLGGIAELVRHGVNGLLVKPNSVHDWRRALVRLSEDRELLGRLRCGVRPPRSMEEVAGEMLDLYRALCATEPPRQQTVLPSLRSAAAAPGGRESAC
jgi:glycosyltransferase involved in cell wall biosynthesis